MEIDPATRRALMPRLLTFEVHGRLYAARQWNLRDWGFVHRRKLTSCRAMMVNAGNGVWDEQGGIVNTDMFTRDDLTVLAAGLCEANSYPAPNAGVQGNLGDVLMVQSAGVDLYMRRLTRGKYNQKRDVSGLEIVIEAAVCDVNGNRVFQHPSDYMYLAAAPLVGVGRLALKLAREEFGELRPAA